MEHRFSFKNVRAKVAIMKSGTIVKNENEKFTNS